MERYRYRCSECGREYEISPDRLVCDLCAREQKPNQPFRGLLEIPPVAPSSWVSDSDGACAGLVPPEGWDPLDLLPVERRFFPSIPVGDTPLWGAARLREATGFSNLWIKDDTLNPTGSLKDRASFLVAAYARSHGIDSIVVASTGNAGSSMAGVGAAAGLSVRLYLPAAAPAAKLTQALQYGAEVVRVEGTYDEASAQSLEYFREHGGITRNTGLNPLTTEGKKTVSLEIFRQLGGVVPDYVFVSVGDGVIVSGVFKGFADLVELGLADTMPTVYLVQAEGSQAIHRALVTGSFGDPQPSKTVADSISVDVPSAGYLAVHRARTYRGRSIVVSDEEILAAQHRLASTTGHFCEPAAAAAAAGFFKAIGGGRSYAAGENSERTPTPSPFKPDDTIVILSTGSGLKDIESAAKGVKRG